MPRKALPCTQMTKNIILHAVLVFIFAFLFIVVYYLGLPVDFSYDYLDVSLRTVGTVSFQDLIKFTLNPFSAGWFYPPDRHIEYLRPLQILLFQLFHLWMPASLVPFHVAAAIGHGLLALMIFFIIYHWTSSLVDGWLAVLLHASFPSNFFIMGSIASLDFQYYVSILTISALILFFSLTIGKFRSTFSFLTAFVAWFVILWIDIKLKSSEKIIPFVCFGILLVRFRFILTRISFHRLCTLAVGVMATAIILVVPQESVESWFHRMNFSSVKQTEQQIKTISPKDKRTLSFSIKNAVGRTFYIKSSEYPETPRSFTENLGVPLGVYFWISVLLMPIVLRRQKNHDLFKHFLWCITIWFSSIIAGFSSGSNLLDLRFLNFAYVPAVFLLFLTASAFKETLGSFARANAFFQWFFGLLVMYSIFNNFILLEVNLRHFGGMQSALIRAENDVFFDFYKRHPKGAELYQKHRELETKVVFIDWYDRQGNWFEDACYQLKNEGVLYFYTSHFDPEKLERFRKAGYKVELWNRYDLLDAKPLAFKWLQLKTFLKNKLRKKPKKLEFYIFRIEK